MARGLAVDYSSAVAYMRPEILALGAAKVRGFVAQDRRLEPYRPWLEDILRYAPHTLSAAEEKIASQAGIMASSPSQTYDIFKAADMPYPEVTLSTGEKVRLDDAAYTQYRAVANREDRRKVFRAFWSRHKEFERTLGTTLDAEVKTHLFDKEVHHYGSCVEAALFESNIPVSVYRQLIADVHANLPTLHRYLRLRQRMMGVDTLGYEDLYAPIVKEVDLHYTPEQAMDLVLEAVAPLGPGLREHAAARLRERLDRLDAHHRQAVGGLQRGRLRRAPVPAAELHRALRGGLDAGPRVGPLDAQLPLGPAPALRHARVQDLRRGGGLDAEREPAAPLRAEPDEGPGHPAVPARAPAWTACAPTLFRQVLFAEFELKIHELAEQGQPLTGEKLSEIYLGLLKDYYGDAQGVCRVERPLRRRVGVRPALLPGLLRLPVRHQHHRLVRDRRGDAHRGGGSASP